MEAGLVGIADSCNLRSWDKWGIVESSMKQVGIAAAYVVAVVAYHTSK